MHYTDTIYDYVNCDYNIIKSSLAIINWDIVFKSLHILIMQFMSFITMFLELLLLTALRKHILLVNILYPNNRKHD